MRSIQIPGVIQENPIFAIYIHISKGRNSLKNCSIDQIFFLQVQDITIKFFLFFESYHFQKIISENVKKMNFVAFFWNNSKNIDILMQCKEQKEKLN